MYQFLWLLLLGLYVAYSGGALVAADVETGQLDMLLATPISRSRVAVEKYPHLSRLRRADTDEPMSAKRTDIRPQ